MCVFPYVCEEEEEDDDGLGEEARKKAPTSMIDEFQNSNNVHNR